MKCHEINPLRYLYCKAFLILTNLDLFLCLENIWEEMASCDQLIRQFHESRIYESTNLFPEKEFVYLLLCTVNANNNT